MDFNPNGVVSRFRRRAATRLALFAFGHVSEGSSFFATLGFGPESLWDSVVFQKGPQPQRGCGESFDNCQSIPNIFLIPFDFVTLQQRAQLLLKSNFAMMFLLPGNVLLHRFEIGLAHGEIRVAALPFEVGVIAIEIGRASCRERV